MPGVWPAEHRLSIVEVVFRGSHGPPKPKKPPPNGYQWVIATKTTKTRNPYGNRPATGARHRVITETKYWIPRLDNMQGSGGITGPKLENDANFAATWYGDRWIPWKAVMIELYDYDEY